MGNELHRFMSECNLKLPLDKLIDMETDMSRENNTESTLAMGAQQQRTKASARSLGTFVTDAACQCEDALVVKQTLRAEGYNADEVKRGKHRRREESENGSQALTGWRDVWPRQEATRGHARHGAGGMTRKGHLREATIEQVRMSGTPLSKEDVRKVATELSFVKMNVCLYFFGSRILVSASSIEVASRTVTCDRRRRIQRLRASRWSRRMFSW